MMAANTLSQGFLKYKYCINETITFSLKMFLDKNKSLSRYYESALQNFPEDLTRIRASFYKLPYHLRVPNSSKS